MRQTIDELYNRVGRYLAPTITNDTVLVGARAIPLPIEHGVCELTGIEGRVVSVAGRPTLIEIMWMFATQTIWSKTRGAYTVTRLASGLLLAMTESEIITNIKTQTPIPGAVVYPSHAELLRALVGKTCVFLAFAKRPYLVLEHGLRWSAGHDLVINGQFRLGERIIENGTIPLRTAAELAQRVTDPLRAGDLRYLMKLPERNPERQKKLKDLFKASGMTMDALQALYNASNDEMSLARQLWKVSGDVSE